jgi:putative protein-disulfide isomerase
MAYPSNKTLLYITDPMCSWCWGFSPVMEQVIENYQDHLSIEILVGGLRPGNTERFDTQRRAYILGHWHAVHERTGQPFDFTFNMSPDFIYDTEPASRAFVVVRTLAPSNAFPFLKALQQAFYVHNKDVTKEETLVELASSYVNEPQQFLESFQNKDTKQKVWKEFDSCRQLGVEGFPTLLGKEGEHLTPICHGYKSMQSLTPIIDSWLNNHVA